MSNRAEATIYAIDIGDSFLKSAAFTKGVLGPIVTKPTPKTSRHVAGEVALFGAVKEILDEMQQKSPAPEALAISASGIMTLQPKPNARTYGPFKDLELHVLAPNVDGLKYVPLQARIEALGFGVPVHVENDVNAALHSATEISDAICISLGGGLGAAIKRDGIVQHPTGSWSCYEIGHGMRWHFDEAHTRLCHCGNNGCLEAVVGGWAMRERYRCAPEAADSEMYRQMADDVIEFLPQAIAGLIEQSGIASVVLSGKGSTGYAQIPEFLERLQNAVETAAGVSLDEFRLIHFNETAELQGCVEALFQNNVLSF